MSAQAAAEDATLTAARMLGEHGIEAYWDHDYVAANDSLEKAFRLFATPTLGLWSARARVSLGRLVEAAERYRDAHHPRQPRRRHPTRTATRRP